MATHEIPGDKSRVDISFEPIGDRNTDILMKIVNNPANNKVNQYYSACMNTDQIERDGLAPLNILWSSLVSLPSANLTLATNMAFLYKNGLSGFFDFGVEIDSSDPTQNIYSLHQGGLSLPDPSYYFDDTVFPAYLGHIANMFKLAGASSSQAGNEANNVAFVEKTLANITVAPDQLFDPFSSFNKMDWYDFIAMMNNLPVQDLINALGVKMDVDLTIDAVNFFSALDQEFGKGTFAPTQISSYFRWRILHSLANKLPQAFANENFNFFGKILSGLSVPSPRNRTCLMATDSAMPELTGTLFAQQAFPASSKTATAIIMDSIISAFEVNSQKLDWMDPVTTQKAIEKLQKILVMIGSPENPRNYTSWEFGNSYAPNYFITVQDDFKRLMNTAGGPSNRKEWGMSAFITNAYYSPTQNSITLLAGILQSPFFNPTFPAAMNYGGIGMVSGHELTHSLDSQGRDFNGEGKLQDWWAPRTSQEFQKRVDCIIAQYSKLSPLPGFYVNGNLTQGENIADAGGLKTAHSAYMFTHSEEARQPSIVPGLTNEQLFFVGFAQTWCSKLTPAAIKNRLLTDPHSPPKFRVNGPTINLPAFSDAFKCPAGTPMNPFQRCQIW
jgi:putative endopeptidase